MLGNAGEAFQELKQISPAARNRPEVLMCLWEIHARSRQWVQAIDAADQLIARSPDQPEGYIKRAYALHELKRTQEAWDNLPGLYWHYPVTKLRPAAVSYLNHPSDKIADNQPMPLLQLVRLLIRQP